VSAPRARAPAVALAAFALAAVVAAGATPARADATAGPPATATTSHRMREGWSVGYRMHRAQDDFGIGGAFASPLFAHSSLRLTLGGAIAWSPHDTTESGDQAWASYGEGHLVVEGGMRAPGSPVRLYGFGGPMVLLLPSRMSDDRIAIGGLGGFGFEYYFLHAGSDGPVSYFTELGGIGTGARADRLPGRPLLSNGFFINVGFRLYL
jgi:hypothetical protein